MSITGTVDVLAKTGQLKIYQANGNLVTTFNLDININIITVSAIPVAINLKFDQFAANRIQFDTWIKLINFTFNPTISKLHSYTTNFFKNATHFVAGLIIQGWHVEIQYRLTDGLITFSPWLGVNLNYSQLSAFNDMVNEYNQRISAGI